MRKTFWFLAAAILSGCAPLLDSTYVDPTPRPMEFAFNRVKLIQPEISRDDDPSTYEQDEYELAPTRRLLLNFNRLHEHVGAIRTDGTHKVQGRFVVLGDAAEAADSISLCPLTRKFMLLSTWEAAYANGTERWRRPGGDFDQAGCVKGAADPADAQVLLFDLTRWFIDYPRGRRVYYGLIALSTKAVRIAGDLSGASNPRMLWTE
ncbi:MAG TPA: hypothetical protein VM598_13000 [Bdellovibrionota bacterium]|nr:hypothetical protein [Bdellovibrionota bacterium]